MSQEQRPHLPAGQHIIEHIDSRAVGHDHALAHSGHALDRLQFPTHPSSPAVAAFVLDQIKQPVIPVLHQPQRLIVIGRSKQSVDDRQQHQQRSGQQVGDQGSQPVVVTEPDLVHADRVFLVDDLHGTVFEERVERVADVEISPALGEILGRQQQLRRVRTMSPEAIVVVVDQPSLSGGRGRLQVRQVLGAGTQIEHINSGSHRPAGNDDHFPSCFPNPDHGLDQRGDAVDIQRGVGPRNHVRADFHDQRLGRLDHFTADKIHGNRHGEMRLKKRSFSSSSSPRHVKV